MSDEKNTQNEGGHPAPSGETTKAGNSQGTAADGDITSNADNDSVTTGRIASTERSSASSTKTNVSGSDLDGQTSF